MEPLAISWDNSEPLTTATLKDASVRSFVSRYLKEQLSPHPHQWFREVALCLFTPQTSPLRAEAAMQALWPEIERGTLTASYAAEVLGRSDHYVRFHNVKAKRVVELVEKRQKVESLLNGVYSGADERDALFEIVNGFGLKEASHALRNIGRRGSCAIFDRHIFRNLVSLGVIDKVPTALSEKGYRELERTYLSYLRRQKLDIDEVDLIMWGHQTGFLYK